MQEPHEPFHVLAEAVRRQVGRMMEGADRLYVTEVAEREQAAEKAAKRQRILEIIERKQGAALEEKSEEDLKKMLEEL